MGLSWLDQVILYEFWGNTGYDYMIALGVFLSLMLVFYFTQKILLFRAKKIAKKTDTDVDDFIINVVKNIRPPFYFIIALYSSLQYLLLNGIASKLVYAIFIIALIIQLILILQRVIDFIVERKTASLGSVKDEAEITGLITQLVKIGLWIVGVLLVLSNLGVNITSLIAGLGIGGIAIALATQNVLGDVFSSFSIYLDKPFKVGDFISTATDSGTVKKIGIQTTRIKALTGNELIIPNKDLTGARINNFKMMERRRVAYKIGVVYSTPSEKLKKIPGIIQEVVEAQGEEVSFDRTHLKNFGDFSLLFEIVYFIEVPSYEKYMDMQQAINLGIIEAFEKEGIAFAFPSQTIYLNNQQ